MNNSILNNVLNEIVLHKTQKVSATRESPELLDSDCNKNNIFQVERMSLEETKKKLNDVSVHLNTNRKSHMGLKTKII